MPHTREIRRAQDRAAAHIAQDQTYLFNRQGAAPRGPLARALRLACLAGASIAAISTATVTAEAADFIWTGGTSDWNTTSNWNTGTVADGGSNTAVFQGTGSTTVNLSSSIALSSIRFDAGAQAYTISTSTASILAVGNITNNSSQIQTFNSANAIQIDGAVTGTRVNFNVDNNRFVQFFGTAEGASAAVSLNGLTSTLGAQVSDGSLTIGSVSGNGRIRFSAQDGGAAVQTLRIGALNLSTEFSGQILNVAQDGNVTGSIEKIGTGTLILSGANAYSGTTTITAGTLQIGNGGTGGTLGAGNVINNASLVFNRSNAFTVGNLISGSGTLTKQGTGTLTLSGANTFSGGTVLSAGTLQLANASALGTGNITFNMSGASLVATTNVTLTPATFRQESAVSATLAAAAGSALTINAGTYSAVGNAGTVLRIGSATNTGTVVLGATTSVTNQVFNSEIIIDGGTLRQGSGRQFIFNAASRGMTIGTSATTATLDLGGATELVSIGSLSGNANGVITNSGAAASLQINNTANTTFAGSIQNGSNPFTVAINSTNGSSLTLTGANTYTGDTTIGFSILYSGNLIGGAANTFAPNSRTIVTPQGILDLGGFAQTINTVVLEGGTIRSGTLTSANGITSSGGTITDLAGTTGLTVTASTITGASPPAIPGIATSGITTLIGTNAYTGATTITGGTLQVGNGGATGTLGAANVLNNGTLAFNRTDAFTVSNAISGSGAVNQIGTGITTLSGANSYAGGTTISAGRLTVSADNNLGAAAGAVTLSGGTLQAAGTFSMARTITATSVAGGIDVTGANTLTLTGTLNGTANFTKSGAGTLTFGAGLNTAGHTGGMTLAGGVLSLRTNLAAGFGTITTTGSVIDYADGVTSAAPIKINSNTTQLQVLAGSATQSGAISETGGARPLEKIGAGTLILTGTNTYTGSTAISEGALVAGNASALGTGGVTFSASGTSLIADFDGTLANNYSLNSGVSATIAAATGRTVSLTGRSNFDLGSTLRFGSASASGTVVWQPAFGSGGSPASSLSIDGGTLRLGSVGAASVIGFFGSLGSPGGVNVDATLDLNGFSATANNLTGGASGVITNGGAAATLTVNSVFASTTFAGVIRDGAGALGLTKAGNLTLTLTGANTYSGLTTISGGTLQIGNGGTTGTLGTGSVLNNAALVFNRSNDLTVGNFIAGGGTLTKLGGGTLTLSGINSYTGLTSVNAGRLLVNGSLTGSGGVNVASGATLGGTGTISGLTTIASGGVLAAGASPGTLTFTNLTLNAGSITQFELGTPGIVGGATNDLIVVSGDLSVASGAILNITAPLSGYYRLFNVTGTGAATASNFTITGLTGGTVYSLAGTPNVVNLIVAAAGQIVQFWDGADPAGATAGAQGGAGTWNAANGNWTGNPTTGFINDVWRSSVGVFATPGGAVTVSGTQSFAGLQFSADGYTLSGGTLAMTGNPAGNAAASFLNIDTGVTTTIGSVLSGAGIGLDKIGAGTLTLTGANTYSGLTTISAGTLSIAAANNLGDGSATNGLVINGGTLRNTAFVTTTRAVTIGAAGGTIDTVGAFSLAGTVTFTGQLIKTGPAPLNLAAANSGTGDIRLNQGTIGLFNGATLGTGTLTMAEGTTLFFGNPPGITLANAIVLGGGAGSNIDPFNFANPTTLSGVLSGGQLNVVGGGGRLVLTGANTYGATTVANANILRIGAGGTTGTLGTLGVTLTGAGSGLEFNRSDTITVANVISGLGTVTQLGTGTTILTGANTYTGLTTISAGVLQIGNGGTTGVLGTGNVTNNATLVFNRSDTVTWAQAISGTGSLTKQGAGALILTGANAYAGGTTISSGMIEIRSNSALGTGGVAMAAGTVLAIGPGVTFDPPFVTRGAGAFIQGSDTLAGIGTLRFSFGAASSGNLRDGAVGRLAVLADGGSQVTLVGSNTFTGGLAVSGAGTRVRLAAPSAAGGAGNAITLSGGLLSLGVGTFANSLALNAAGGRIEVTTGEDATLSAAISQSGGAFGFEKTGAGTLTLTGANAYAGTTTISGGTLRIGAGGTSGALGTGNVVNNGALVFDRSDAITVSNVISGTGSLAKQGAGTLVLTGANTYSGLTTISAGTLSIAAANNLGDGSATNGLVIDGGTLQNTAILDTGRAVRIGAAGGTVDTIADLALFGSVEFTGQLTKTGGALLALTGANTGAGGVALNQGQIGVGADGSLGTGTLTMAQGTTLLFGQPNTTLSNAIVLGGGTGSNVDPFVSVLSGVVSGGQLNVTGAIGFLTLTGANTYGATTVAAGNRLTIGAGGTAGTLGTGGVTLTGATSSLAFNRSDTITVGNIISGLGTVSQIGTGTTILTGANTYTGLTSVNAGRLLVNGSLAGAVSVASGATLGGIGTIAGAVNVLSGGIFAPGASPGTLTVGNLTLASGSTSLFELGAPGVAGGASNDLVNVTGNLSVAAGAILDVGNTVSGYYRLFNVAGTGAATASNFTVTSGAGLSGIAYALSAAPNQVNLFLSVGGQIVQFWDGADTSGATAGAQGGAGTWSAANGNWTANPTSGLINDTWRGGVGVFAAPGGAVTVAGTQAFQGLQFTSDGYALSGGTLNMTGNAVAGGNAAASFVNVDTGTTASIGSVLTGIGLDKLGGGTLTLTGANTYTGLTTISAGTLRIASANALGSTAAGTTVSAGATLALAGAGTTTFAAEALTLSGTGVGGLGALRSDAGAAGRNTWSGAIALAGATRIQSDAGTLSLNGAIGGAGQALTLGGAGDGAVNGVIATGTGTLTKDGTGIWALSAVNSYTGLTTVAGGILSNFGTIAGDVLAQATTLFSNSGVTGGGLVLGRVTVGADGLAINNSTARIAGGVTVLAGGQIQSSGVVDGGAINAGTAAFSGQLNGGVANDAGALTLTGATAGIGRFTQAAGATFNVNGVSTTIGSLAGAGSITLGAAVLTTGGDGTSTSFAGVISGAGGLVKAGAGAFTLSGASTFTGLTSVNAGTLIVNGAIGGAANVASGATLGGSGTIAGNVSVASGGALSPGSALGTLTIGGNLTLAAGSTTMFGLNAPNIAGGPNNDLINVGGNLSVAAGAILNIGSAVSGYYRLFNVTGTGAGTATNFTVAGAATGTVYSLSASPNQVNLFVSVAGQLVQFWDGADTSGATPGAQGGTGTWNTANGNWTANPDSAVINDLWRAQVGVFRGTAGTVTVAGTQAFQGLQFSTTGYTLSGGTLNMTGNAVTGGNANASFINVDSGVTATVASTLSGLGLDKLGTGTLILTANNTYTGATQIAGGTLQLGNGGTTGSLGTNTGAVANNGTLAFARSDAVTFANVISGSGRVVQAGTGTLRLTGTNTYTGGTTISSGRLIVSMVNLPGNVVANGTLQIDQATNATFAGVLSGTGLFEKTGAGRLDLTSNSAGFTGATSVLGGDLAVNGSLAGSIVTVGSGATLSGSGTVGGIVALAGSTISTGNSPGTLTVNGNIVFNAGSTYFAELVIGGANDRLNATGTASLAGTLSLSITGTPGAFNQRLTLLQAQGGITGRFTTVTSAPPLAAFRATLDYDASGVFVSFAPGLLQPLLPAGASPNARAGGAILDAASQTSGFDANPLFPLYTLSGAALAEALADLGPEAYAQAARAGLEDERFIRDAVLDRLAYAQTLDGPADGAWIRGFASEMSVDSNGNAAEATRRLSGFVAGADMGDAWENGIRAGGEVSFLHSDIRIDDRGSRASLRRMGLGLYTGLESGPFRFRLMASASQISGTMRRAYAAGGTAYRATSDLSGATVQLAGEAAWHWTDGRGLTLEPFAGLAWSRVRIDGADEGTGAGALAVDGRTHNLGLAELGLRGTWTSSLSPGWTVALEGQAAARFAFGDTDIAAFAGLKGGPSFRAAATSAPIDDVAAAIDLGIAFANDAGFSAGIAYNGLVSSTTQDHGARLTMQLRF